MTQNKDTSTLDVEHRILGVLIDDKSKQGTILSRVEAHHFNDDTTRLIFKKILELKKRKIDIDTFSVSNALKNKLSTYEARSVSGNLRQTTAEKQKYRKKTDPGLLDFMYELNKSMRKNLTPFNDEKAYIPNSTAEAGHNPVPVGLMKNIKFLNK